MQWERRTAKPRTLLTKRNYGSPLQRSKPKRKGVPSKKAVDNVKKAIDTASYKEYYVNYKIWLNPQSTAWRRFRG